MPSRCLATRYASLRVPQCSVFSILPPFSAQLCSMPERTFLISSSGVAGRAMKIRSYNRSSLVASFLFSPGRSARENRLLLFFPCVLGRLAPVVLVHRRVDSLGEDHSHRIASLGDHFGGDFHLRLLHRPQHMLFAAAHPMIRAAAEPEARKILRVEGADHRLRAVVTAGAAVRVNPDRAPGKLNFVP